MISEELISSNKNIREFLLRKKTDPSCVTKAKNGIWEYITVHPMSNEKALLKNLGMTPKECIKVDCYWHIGFDVVFLQVYSKSLRFEMEPGIYARWDEKNNPMLYISAYTNKKTLSQKTIEQVMLLVANSMISSSLFSKDAFVKKTLTFLFPTSL